MASPDLTANAAPQEATTDDDDLLADYFEKSASAVRNTFGRFEQGFARPTIDYVLASFKARPAQSTFLAIYFALSVFPVLSFLGFLLFIFATFIFSALAVAIFAASCVVGFFGFWLACTLLLFLFISVNLTLSALALYTFIRFTLRVRQEGPRVALSELAQDARAKLPFSGGKSAPDTNGQPHTHAHGPESHVAYWDEDVGEAPVWDVKREPSVDPRPQPHSGLHGHLNVTGGHVDASS